MCGRLVNLDTVARVLAEYYHLKTDTQLAALNDALSRVPAETVGKELFGNSEQLESGHEKDHVADPGKMVGDLISRQEAIATAVSAAIDWHRLANPQYSIAYSIGEAMMALPSAQPDIVACGDCIHWICHDRRCGYWNHGVKPLDWCCHAERRSDG